uniref:Uncharacterized protein n=1 Tax=Oryzias sinensis TaxID=183150 RepID=A0A8C7YB25_9TELE
LFYFCLPPSRYRFKVPKNKGRGGELGGQTKGKWRMAGRAATSDLASNQPVGLSKGSSLSKDTFIRIHSMMETHLIPVGCKNLHTHTCSSSYL